MEIPDKYSGRYVYHFTHISNLEGLLKNGLLANNHSDFPKTKHLSVAEKTIQERRSKMVVTCGPGGVVHDYVPLYFCSLSPMLLAVIKKKIIDQEEMIYLEFPIEIMKTYQSVFSNTAANTEVPPDFYISPKDLDELNWTEIDSASWKSKSDALKQQRMAELLIHRCLPLNELTNVVVFSEKIKLKVINIANNLNIKLPNIQIGDVYGRRHFFTDFSNGNNTHSCVAGPEEVYNAWKKVVTAFKERTIVAEYKFQSLSELLIALRNDLNSVPYTAELVDLEVDNPSHKECVDQHVKSVVRKLIKSNEFNKLNNNNKILVEIAAYIHDIGKGPKARWLCSDRNKMYNGKQKTDDKHPVRAAPMLVDIFCNFIKEVNCVDIKRLTFLVLYHDFIGDLMVSNRNPNEIINRFIYDSEPIDMLLALSKADSKALSEEWWDDGKEIKIRDILLKK